MERSFSKKICDGISLVPPPPPPRGKRGEAFGYFRLTVSKRAERGEASSERDHLTRDCARGSMNLDHHVVGVGEGEIDGSMGRREGGEGRGERLRERDTAFSSVDGGEC